MNEMELSKENVKTGLTSNALKLIAIITMTTAHSAIIFYSRYSYDIVPLFMNGIGRLTAPIMMFLIVEGYHHTRNLKKYILRLFILAIISHFAYAFCFDKHFNSVFDQTSVIWAYMLGLIALAIRESDKLKTWQKHLILFPVLWAAFPADWSTPAAFAIIYMGLNYGNFKRQMISLIICIAVYAIIYAIFLNFVYGLMQMLIVLAIPLLYQYNGQRGTWKGMKWFFYIYYPLHLTILGLIRVFVLHKGVN
ncbi:conjugal transfer protein TraX [Treponema sp. R8-4-B8]